jgi:hypothetical protein
MNINPLDEKWYNTIEKQQWLTQKLINEMIFNP